MKKRYTKAITEMFQSLSGQEVAILETDENGKLLYPEEHQKYIDYAIEQVNKTMFIKSTFKLGYLRGFLTKEGKGDKTTIIIGMFWRRSKYMNIPSDTYLPKFEVEWIKGNWNYLMAFYIDSENLGLSTSAIKEMYKEMTSGLPFWANG